MSCTDTVLGLVAGAGVAVVAVTPVAGAGWLASAPREQPASEPPTSVTATIAIAIRVPVETLT
jgi:hypothetical protein